MEKLDSKSLMLGDWVRLRYKQYGTGKEVVKDFQVSELRRLYKECLDVDAWSKESGNMGGIEKLEPIPLTPEILEKNGFENDFYEDESVADYVKVRLEGYSLRCKANGWDSALVTWCNGHLEVVTDFNGEVRRDIDYVHELQRALKLCNIDKEIVL